jgi:lysophospholipase L1-like esterase
VTDRTHPARFAAVGDSLTVSYVVPGSLRPGQARPAPWPVAASYDGLEYAGGWAVSGATTDEMADGIRPIADLDALVIMGGTNNLYEGRGFQGAVRDFDRICAVCPAPTVLVAAIPPYELNPPAASDFNTRAHDLAADRGWRWADPWTDLRGPDGRWAAELRCDGVHPRPEGYALVAAAFHRILGGLLRH